MFLTTVFVLAQGLCISKTTFCSVILILVYLTWNFVCKTKLTTPVLYLSVLSYSSCCYTMRKLRISQFKMDCSTIVTDHKNTSEHSVYNNKQEFCFHSLFSMMSTKLNAIKNARVLRSPFVMMTNIILQFPCSLHCPIAICCLLSYNQTVNSSR